MTININLPNLKLRPYQLPAWRALESGCRRAAFTWPRRACKDTTSLAWTAFDSQRKVGGYWHLFPEAAQARKAIWNGINREGQKIIDVAFPPPMRKKTLDNEMFIEFHNGSTWQLSGSDRYDSLVGSNPRGVVFSEYALSNPLAYQFVRPILAENGGWAVFPTTPRGRNHYYELYNNLLADPNSFAEILTVDDTQHMDEKALATERAEMSEELFLQEFYCSFDFGLEGAFYAKQMNKVLKDERVCAVPYDERYPVWVACDIGLRDNCSWWFCQIEPGGRIKVIDYEEHQGEQLAFYVKMLKDKPYVYGDHIAIPHDGGHERLGMESIQNQLRDSGIDSYVLPVERSVLPGIEAVRVALGKCLFDAENTTHGRHCLSSYRREYDNKRNVFKPTPLHDWSSDGADAFRYMVRAVNLGLFNNQGMWGDMDYTAQNRAAI